MSDIRTWTPEVSYLNEERGETLMRPAQGGIWVSISDHKAALDRAEADKEAAAGLAYGPNEFAVLVRGLAEANP